MKQNRELLAALCALLLALAFTPVYSQVYHIDPNSTRGLVPDNITNATSAAASVLDISNNNSQVFKVLISTDNAHWQQDSVKARDKKEFTCKELYVKIYTTTTKYKYYRLLQGYAYSITWDREGQLWVLR